MSPKNSTRSAAVATGRAVTAITLSAALLAGMVASVENGDGMPSPSSGMLTVGPGAEVIEVLVAQRARITSQAEGTTNRIAAAGTVSTATLTALAEDHTEALEASKQALPRERHTVVSLVPLLSATETAEDAVSEIAAAADEAIAALEATAAAFEAELAAERERIRVAEEARAAAAAAAAARAKPSGTNRSYGAPRANEDVTARVGRLASSLPFHVPYRFGTCPNSPLACYYIGGDIVLNPGGISGLRDCRVIYGLAHEYKHMLQFQAGQIQFDGAGNITNTSWLESDAMQFGYRYGCRP